MGDGAEEARVACGIKQARALRPGGQRARDVAADLHRDHDLGVEHGKCGADRLVLDLDPPDLTDRDPRAAKRVIGLGDAEASAKLGLVDGGLAYWIAAARECFEEAGILIATKKDGRR